MDIFPRVLIASAIVCSGVVPHFASAQSFDCRKADIGAERAICDSNQLKYLDSLLDQTYRFTLKNPKLRARARQSQKSWLEKRNKCGGNYSCLLAAYQNRLVKVDTGNFSEASSEGQSVSGKVPACAPSDVSVQSSIVGDGGTVISNVYYFVNKGKHACSIEGYPNLSAYDKSGKIKANGISYENSPDYTTDPPPKIAPVVISPGNRVAWFLIQGARGCDTGVNVKMALPHSRKWLTTWEFPNGGCRPVEVSPVRPVTTLLPPP